MGVWFRYFSPMKQLELPCFASASAFAELSRRVLENEGARAERGEITVQSHRMFEGRLRRHVLPFFQHLAPQDIRQPQITAFTQQLADAGLQRSSIKQILTSLRRVLVHAHAEGLIAGVPEMPRMRSDSVPRGGFSVREYLALWHAARTLAGVGTGNRTQTHRDTANGLFARDCPLPAVMPQLIRFMVNSFVRPTDLRWMKHRHVQVCRGRHTYLRLELPETKKHSSQIVTLRPAVRVYEQLLESAQAQGYGQPDDFVFFPELPNRSSAMMLIDVHFRRLLEHAGLRHGKRGQVRTLYSLRHTAITFRLLYGRGIDLLTLARNARTSVEMIEKFYASELSAEMNVDLLQSRRSAG